MLDLIEPSSATQRRFSILRNRIKARTKHSGFVFRGEQPPHAPQPFGSQWLANIKKLLLTPAYVSDVARAFHEVCQPGRSFNVVALETGGIPLATAIALQGAARGLDIRPIIVRKSRNKAGLRQIIEGDPLITAPFVLVDDVVNSGKSLETLRQRIDDIGGSIVCCFTVINFGNPTAAWWTTHFQLPVISLLSLDDFGLTLNTAPYAQPERLLQFETIDKFEITNPNPVYVNPKATPAVDTERVYFGADDGIFYALDRHGLRPRWTFDTGYSRKGIWSSPALHNGSVLFGAYTGELFRLNSSTGEIIWRSMPADFIGGAPVIDEHANLAFVGCEHETRHNLGSLVAIDLTTGEPAWRIPLSGFTHSPGHSSTFGLVAIGSNDGEVIAADSRTGTLKWLRHLPAAVKHRPIFFSAPSPEHSDRPFVTGQPLLAVPCHDGTLYVLDALTGHTLLQFPSGAAIHGAPLVLLDRVYYTSCDQHLRRGCLATGEVDGKFYAGSRIMTSPVYINDRIYFGTNAGSLFEIHPITLAETGWCNFPDRVTGNIAASPDAQTLYVHTNEDRIYALRRLADSRMQIPQIAHASPSADT